MRLVETLTTTGPALRSSQRWTTRTTVASGPSGMPCSSTTTSRSASASWAKPTSAPERRTRSPSSARLASSGSGCCRQRRVRTRVDGDHVAAQGLEQAKRGNRRGAAPGIHRDREPPRSDALDVDGLRDRAEVAGGGRRVRANVGHVQGPHPGVEALVIEVGELGRLVGPKGQSLGADEPERVPLERAVASARPRCRRRRRPRARGTSARGRGRSPTSTGVHPTLSSPAIAACFTISPEGRVSVPTRMGPAPQ